MKRKILSLLAASLLLMACSVSLVSTPEPSASPTPDVPDIAATMQAEMTAIAALASPTSLPSNTPLPTNTLLPSSTPLPTATPLPTFTPSPIPTNTAVPTSTPTPVPCNLATFIGDVNFPDGAQLSESAAFTKIWRVKNSGSCTWDSGYKLVYVSGNKMNAPQLTVDLPKTVKPGETVDLAVKFISPDKEGTYQSDWLLRAGNNVQFGMGAQGKQNLWVRIEVVEMDHPFAFSFAENFCHATWRSGAGKLPCWGLDKDPLGFAQLLARPVLENGKQDNEPALLLFPQAVNDGWVSGEFPDFTVQAGDTFVAQIGCLFNHTGCNVTFRLDYRNANDVVKTLGEWTEKFDGSGTTISVDLSELDGKTVNFILYVEAHGSSSDDYAYWFYPRIER
jgi:hypothetical protein